MSVAKYCRENRMLGATLFIDRNIPETTNPDKYFATLTAQILHSLVVHWGFSDASEVVQQRLCDIFRRDPAVFDRMTIHQATTLFAKTVKDFSRIIPNFLDPANALRLVIIIDGFDDVDSERIDETA
ncbi:hypothetical protein H0H87_002464, partial [Tephrocybe sp. NHM501043]